MSDGLLLLSTFFHRPWWLILIIVIAVLAVPSVIAIVVVCRRPVSPTWTTPSSLQHADAIDIDWFKDIFNDHPKIGPLCSEVTAIHVDELRADNDEFRAGDEIRTQSGTHLTSGLATKSCEIKRVHITYNQSETQSNATCEKLYGGEDRPSSLVLKFSDFQKIKLGFRERALGELGGY